MISCGRVLPSDPPDPAPDTPPVDPGAFEWQQNMFGSFPAVTAASDRAYVSASQFAALDLGGGILVPGGATDFLSARFDATGAHEASWRHGGVDEEFQTGMSIDPFGNASVAGLYRGAGNAGGPALPPSSTFAGFAASYLLDGTQRWQLALTSNTGEVFPRTASTNGSANTAIAGHFSGVLDIGGQQRQSLGRRDAFYLRVNDAGEIATFVTLGGAGDDSGNAALFDSNGTVILVGTFTGRIEIGTIVLDAGVGRDLFVVRASIQGAPMWAIQGGNDVSDVGDLPSAAVTPTGDIVVTTEFQNSFQMTGDPAVTSAGATDIVVAKITSAGVVEWTKAFGGDGQDHPRAIAANAGAIALTGEFSGTTSFGGETFASRGFLDSYVVKLTEAGEHVWSRQGGGTADDRGLGIAIDPVGAVYHTGSFHGTASFGGPPLTASGIDFNGVLVKYAP